MASERRVDLPAGEEGPNGGAYLIFTYTDGKELVDEDDATVQIVKEYDSADRLLMETFMVRDGTDPLD